MVETEAQYEPQQGPVTRLYRGLSRPYRNGQLDTERFLQGTNFTDCPMAALTFARGRNGVLLVVEVPEDSEVRMSEATWHPNESGPKRIMLWGAQFDPYIVAEIPAKDLRAEVRKKGVRTLPDSVKSGILVRYLNQRISGTASHDTTMLWPHGLIPRQL